ncbi:MAG: response regulator [Acidobacteriaceae bacterium]|nr:response regulator [Acidobacteriaceae bacterium]
MPQTARNYNILVVEDNPGDVLLIREAFAECGRTCCITVADCSQQAKDLLNSQSFDMVISDMGFRAEEGADFIRSIRANPRLKTLPIIVLSGSPNPRPAYAAGANAFVAKTIDVDSFFEKIRVLMHFWMEVVELPRSSGTE